MKTHAGNGHTAAAAGASRAGGAGARAGRPVTLGYPSRRHVPRFDPEDSAGLNTPTPLQMSETEVSESFQGISSQEINAGQGCLSIAYCILIKLSVTSSKI